MIVALPHTLNPPHLVMRVSIVQARSGSLCWGSQSLCCLVYLRLWVSCSYVQGRVPVYGFCFLLMCPINAIWSVRWKRPNHVFDAVPGPWQAMCLFSQCLWYGCTSLPVSKGVSYRQVSTFLRTKSVWWVSSRDSGYFVPGIFYTHPKSSSQHGLGFPWCLDILAILP